MANHSGIIDSGTYFQIVPSTRKIVVPSAYRVIGTVGEHYAEQLTFKIPKLVDGHDIANCSRKYVTWKNINDDIGHDELKNMTEDGEDLYFTWDVSGGLTVAKGLVSFSVHFEDVDVNGDMLYRWSTTTCTECEILDTINGILNTYESVYVGEGTLVFENYNAVENGVLPLDMPGIIPEGTRQITENGIYPIARYAFAEVAVDGDSPTGTKEITRNGTYDVTDFAEVKVEIPLETPQISVSDNGIIKTTASGIESQVRLDSSHDSEFVASNIKKGVNIFGVDGSYDIVPTGSQKITENGVYDVSSFDSVNVDIPFDTPTISINPDTGNITSTANGKTGRIFGHTLANYDSEFTPENIREGVTIFGTTGTCEVGVVPKGVTGQIYGAFDAWYNGCPMFVFVTYWNEDGEKKSTFIRSGEIVKIYPALGSSIYIEFRCDTEFAAEDQERAWYWRLWNNSELILTRNVEHVFIAKHHTIYVVKAVEDDFIIELRTRE